MYEAKIGPPDMLQEFRLEFVADGMAMAEALAVRRRVFIEEQNVPESLEIDEHDAEPSEVTTAVHALGRLNGAAIATGRLLLEASPDRPAHIGRVAVLKEHRGRGYGREVMLALHDKARELGYSAIVISAQVHAIGFYERLGYIATGGVYLEAGIEHREMELRFRA
jgi:predicted GNAT family N-acyltransferase